MFFFVYKKRMSISPKGTENMIFACVFKWTVLEDYWTDFVFLCSEKFRSWIFMFCTFVRQPRRSETTTNWVRHPPTEWDNHRLEIFRSLNNIDLSFIAPTRLLHYLYFTSASCMYHLWFILLTLLMGIQLIVIQSDSGGECSYEK